MTFDVFKYMIVNPMTIVCIYLNYKNYMCSLMMISSMLSKHVGAVKVF